MNTNKAKDLQRTPIFQDTPRDVPIPEADVIDPVAEYNHGELDAMGWIEEVGFRMAGDMANSLLVYVYDVYPDYVQGFFDAVETLAKREA
jgi:hypothetical protein